MEPVEVLSRHELPIGNEDDVVIVRRKVKQLALGRGFDTFAAAAVTTATSEITRNVWVHAGRGRAIVEEVESDGRSGIRMTFVDEGPGIDDVPRVLAGGYSTAKSL